MTAETPRRARHPAALTMQLRSLHAIIGMLIAPTVLFMAFTGVLQIYDLHEGHPGYKPPALIEKLGLVHKKQTFAAIRRGPPPGFRFPGARAGSGGFPFDDDFDGPPGPRPAAGQAPQAHAEGRAVPRAPFGEGFARRGPPKPKAAVTVLKGFFTATAVGLFVSTLIGIWMALRDRQRRLRNLVLLLMGAAVPIVLAALTV